MVMDALQMAWPSVLESFFVALAGLIDTMMVSAMGPYAVAAVGLTAQPKFIEWILRVKSNIDSGQFRPMMKAAIEALHAPDDWYAEVNAEYARRRTVAEQIMAALGCHIDPEQGGLFLWGRIPDDYRDAEQLADEVLERARVFIVPGFIFGSRGNRYVRLSLCATVDKLQEALNRINNDMK